MCKQLLVVSLALSCAGPAAQGPTMTPSPDRNPNSAAAAAMAPSQPIQQYGMVTVPPPQTAQQNQRARVQVMLEAHPEPPSSQELLAQGPGVYHALTTIFHDPTAPLATRARAESSLANIADSRGFAELHGVIASPSTESPLPFFARTAIAAVARAQGARAVPDIALGFAWKDPTVRTAAAEALGQIGGPDARAALQQRLAEESDPGVREALQRALAKATP